MFSKLLGSFLSVLTACIMLMLTALGYSLPYPDSPPQPAKPVKPAQTVPAAPPPAQEYPVTLTLSFAGDCTLGWDDSFSYQNSFPQVLMKEKNDFAYFFRNVKSIFQADDLTLVNLETTLTQANKKAVKKFRFKGEPSYTGILQNGSIEAVNLANNHIYDYLQQGFRDTVKNLDKAGIGYSGEGYIGMWKLKDKVVASLGFTGWDTSQKKKIGDEIAKLRKTCDILVVSFHWGNEYAHFPNNVQTELGRYSIDQGADIVVGHHPHVIQGIEEYKGRYIVYSMGNFCFGGNRNPPDKDTFIFQSTFTFLSNASKTIQDIQPRVIPCSISSVQHINNYQPTPLEGEASRAVLKRLSDCSKPLKYGWKGN